MLRCEECGGQSDWEDAFSQAGDPRWKGYLTLVSEVVIYCPECAEREFRSASGPSLNENAEP
jgi:hypothetical protein